MGRLFYKAQFSLILVLLCFNNCTQSFESSGDSTLLNNSSFNGDSSSPGGTYIPPTNNGTYKPGPMLESSYRKLTNIEINNKVKAVFEIEVKSEQFIGEEDLTPFNNTIEIQKISETKVSNIEYFSGQVSQIIIANSAALNKIKICQPKSKDDVACLTKIIDNLFNKAFVKLPSSSNKNNLLSKLIALSNESGDFNDAIHALLMYTLQSPRFLYNDYGSGSVFSGVYKLSSIELANKISYLVTGHPADSQLIDDALGGKLDNPNSTKLILDNLFNNKNAQTQLLNFHAMWFGYYNMQLPTSLAINAIQETQAVLNEHILDSDQPWINLLNLDYTYVNDQLAKHYGYAEKNKEGFYKLNYSEGNQPRKGIFSHATFLSAFPKIGDSSPTKRGYHIQKNIFCNIIPRPPEDVDIDEPPKPTNGGSCKADGYKDLQSITACKGCHIKMDNIGLALENFNHLGQFRTNEDKDKSCVIEDKGHAEEIGNFSGLNGFSEALHQNQAVIQNCLVEKKLLFAYGFNVKIIHPTYLKEMQLKFSRHGSYKQLIFDIVQSNEFRSIVWK